MATGKKQVVLVQVFQDEDPYIGMPNFSKPMLDEHFQVVVQSDLDRDGRLYEKVEGIMSVPNMPRLHNENLDRMHRLRVISTVSVGYNHLDITYLKSRGIRIGVCRNTVNDATAELAIALMLACGRDIVGGMQRAMCKEPVSSFNANEFRQEITGSTLGIVGMGGIGFEVARRACGLKMNVFYHNRNQRKDDADVNARYVTSLDEMLPLCDFVIISCPLTQETTGLFSTKQFQLMKTTAFLINIARGQVVDTDALVQALKAGEIAGVGLDVTDPEPLPRDHSLLTLPNVIITPHWGTATTRTRTDMIRLAVDNLRAGLVEGGQMPCELK